MLLQRVADALLLEARLCDAGLGPQPVVGWWRLSSASQERPKVRLILGSAIGQPHADVSACFGDCLRHKRRGSVASAAGGHTHACMSDAHGAQAIAGSGGSNERPSPSEPNACGGGECGATPREHPPCVARSIGMSPHCAPQSGFQSQGNRRMNACTSHQTPSWKPCSQVTASLLFGKQSGRVWLPFFARKHPEAALCGLLIFRNQLAGRVAHTRPPYTCQSQ